MIRLQNLTAGYGGRAVVRDVTMEFRPGEVLAILGPNGSGKSTLLRAALGLLPPMGGTILYNGVELQKLRPKEIARQAAFLTQSRNTPSIQAQRMVLHSRFPYLSYPRRYGKEDWQIARQAMEATGSYPYRDTNVTELSGGQRQGVYLAMALAQNTQTVFMDEPTTYLDVSRQIQTMATARELADLGKAVVLVLHDLSMALRAADRVGVLDQGDLVLCDCPEAVFDSRVLDRVFGVTVHRVSTDHGDQFYCTATEE